jgi:hypothetical protein
MTEQREASDLRELTTKDIKSLKEELHEEQSGICPILKIWQEPGEVVLDHIHKSRKSATPGLEEGGLVRGVINRYANVVLGKIENSWKRTGLSKNDSITLAQALRNMADYIEREPLPYVHPTERIPQKRLKKSSFNLLIKKLKESGFKNKLPEYPSRKLLSKKLAELYKKVNLEPEFY